MLAAAEGGTIGGMARAVRALVMLCRSTLPTSGMHKCQKRPIYMGKEAYLYGKRGLFIWQKRPIYMAKEAYLYGKRGLFIWQKRPIPISVPRPIRVLVMLCRSGEVVWQKRPIYMAKEAYLYSKRGLFI
jgi:hypothetical protein